jgi:hypothetical protein
VPTKVEPNVWYAGALEYVTTNPWGESRERGAASEQGGKGWLLVTLGARRTVRFRAVAHDRRVIDLEPIEGTGLDAAALDVAIAERLAAVPDGIDEQIVRQVVYNVARITAREIDHAAVRAYKASALHYRLDLRRPAPTHTTTVLERGHRQPLGTLVQEYLHARPLPPGVPRDRVVELGAEYVTQTEREET